MPFGLARAPSTYQRFVSSILDPVKRPWLQVYIDDILFFQATPMSTLLTLKRSWLFWQPTIFTFDPKNANGSRRDNP